MTDRFITKTQAADMCGISAVTIWRMEKRGEFPQRRQISANRVAYLESEVTAWMKSRGMDYCESPKTRKQSEAAA
jgi:prophage regulatory protein